MELAQLLRADYKGTGDIQNKLKDCFQEQSNKY